LMGSTAPLQRPPRRPSLAVMGMEFPETARKG
jgi:hypothetical protein